MEAIQIEAIQAKLKNCADVKYREICCDYGTIHLVYIDNLCDVKFISEYIIAPIMENPEVCCDLEKVKRSVITAPHFFIENMQATDDYAPSAHRSYIEHCRCSDPWRSCCDIRIGLPSDRRHCSNHFHSLISYTQDLCRCICVECDNHSIRFIIGAAGLFHGFCGFCGSPCRPDLL